MASAGPFPTHHKDTEAIGFTLRKAEDRNSKVGAGQYTAATIPGAKLSIYEGIGHSPFYEDAPRFNSELGAFVRAANKTD